MSILVAGLQSLPACNGVDPSSMTAYHVARFKRLVDERLRDPALSVASIAAELGISVGHLHRLFKCDPLPPAQYMWNRRLEACGRELLDPRRGKASVAEIAFGRSSRPASQTFCHNSVPVGASYALTTTSVLPTADPDT